MRIGLTFDYRNKAVKSAKNDILALGKSALKATVGITSASVAVAKLNQFLQQSVQAALADEKAYKVLGQTLQNAGFTQATEGVKAFIDAQQLATGVTEDELIPAFTTLFNALESVSAAQYTLQLAQSVALGTGKDLTQVTSAFAKAAKGSTTALQRLGIGLSKAELTSGDFVAILTKLEQKFGSTTAAAIGTTAVRMDRLKIAVSEAKEEVGKGLLDAFDMLAKQGGQDIDSLQTKIIALGTTVGDLARGVGIVTSKLTDIANIPVGGTSLLGILTKISPSGAIWSTIFGKLIDMGKEQRQAAELLASANAPYSGGPRADRLSVTAMGAKLLAQQQRASAAAAAKAKAAELAKQRAAEAQKKRQALLDKKTAETQMQYDVERIGLMKALSAARDADTQKRLTDLLKINTATYAEALGLDSVKSIMELINDQLEKWYGKQSAIKSVTDSTAAAYDALLSKMTTASGFAMSTATPGVSGSNAQFGPSTPWAQAATANAAAQAASQAAVAAQAAAEATTNFMPGGPGSAGSAAQFGPNTPWAQAANNFTINVSGSLIAQADLEDAVASAVNSSARSGAKYSQIFSRL